MSYVTDHIERQLVYEDLTEVWERFAASQKAEFNLDSPICPRSVMYQYAGAAWRLFHGSSEFRLYHGPGYETNHFASPGSACRQPFMYAGLNDREVVHSKLMNVVHSWFGDER